jgi:cyclopropane-fatty-acyl-phospholipid synthase
MSRAINIPLLTDERARAAAHWLLRGIRGGTITVIDASGTEVFGRASADDLRATVRVNSSATYRALFRGGLGLAETYADGLWDCDDLVTLVRIAVRSLSTLDRWRKQVNAVTGPVERLIAMTRNANSRRNSVRNVHHHYDMSNEVFALILDETMGYSCAYYERPDITPVEASWANLARVCRILDLHEGERLLEMGSGWGGLAVYAARNFGCHVSTVTLSKQQRDYINNAAQKAGVADKVEVLLQDYRDVHGRWDKLISLEMIESVGALHLDTFIAQCGALMKPDGIMLMQAIMTSDTLFRNDRYRRTFLNQLIFQGGFTPSMRAVVTAVARHTDLRVAAVYDISNHYPPTLTAWRDRLRANWPQISQFEGFDEHFLRLWTLYFSWCEAGFRERRVYDRQFVLVGPDWRDENRLLGIATDE